MSVSQKVMERMSGEAVRVKTWQDCALLAFLYEKNMVSDSSSPFYPRKSSFEAIINPAARYFGGEQRAERTYQRLLRVLSVKGPFASGRIPDGVISWNDTLRLMPQWNNPKTSFVFHRDDHSILPKNRELLPIQWVHQHKSLCYLSAPVVLQYYLTLKHSKVELKPEILDIPKFLREAYDRDHLENHIFKNEGTSSLDLLESISGSAMDSDMILYGDVDEATLRKHGPVLLSEFPVCDDFGTDDRLVFDLSVCNQPTPDGRTAFVGCDHTSSEDRLIYTGDDGPRCPKVHSMLVVGVRTEGASRRFLVQNWWRRQQFIEISQEYLETLPQAGPFMYVVTAPQHVLRAGFARQARRYEESAHLEAEERTLMRKR